MVMLTESGNHPRKGSRFDLMEADLLDLCSALESLKNGSEKPPPCAGSLIFILDESRNMTNW